jgi:hypothetical protein
MHRQQPHADTAEAVGGPGQHRRDQLGMLGLAADARAVFGVERDVEHRAEFGLQRQALRHP